MTEPMNRQAISDAEERALRLDPLVLRSQDRARCRGCGTTLASGESGLCPLCDDDATPAQKHRQRQKLVQTQGAQMNTLAMVPVLDKIWVQSARPIDPADARRKYREYQGRSGHVPIANNTWMHKDDQGNTFVRHHNTDIMGFRPNGDITVDTGGWDSPTTKARINAFLPSNMKLMRNPSKAADAGTDRVIAHNPNGGSIYPEHHWGQEGWDRSTEPTRGMYGLHRDTVLHPYRDGFTINHETGEVHDNAVEHSGTTAAPPRARGFDSDHPTGAPRSRPSRNYYDTGTSYDTSWNGGPMPSGRPGVSPVVHDYDPTPMHEQQSTHEQIRRQLDEETQYPEGASTSGDNVHMQFSHHDMPQEGESYSDWLDRTTQPAEKISCPSCKGRGVIRSKGPVPEGVQPWEHKENCPSCGGEGLVDNTHRHSRLGNLLDHEALSQVYLTGLHRLAYGETKAPSQVDTLRDDACPVCGESDAFDGDQCQVCGFITPPKMFQDPDLEKAKLLDLRNDPASGAPNDIDPNVGQNLPPVDPEAVDEEGEVGDETAEEEPIGADATEVQDEDNDGTVEGEVRTLDDGPADPKEVDANGDVLDPDAAKKRVNQGGEAFTKGPNAPTPAEPMDPATMEAEEEDEDEQDGEPEAADGQAEVPDEGEAEGAPGYAGDGTPDLFCPACGFEADASAPLSTSTDAQAPADAGNGMLEGDVCPNCQKATLIGVGELEQMEGS